MSFVLSVGRSATTWKLLFPMTENSFSKCITPALSEPKSSCIHSQRTVLPDQDCISLTGHGKRSATMRRPNILPRCLQKQKSPSCTAGAPPTVKHKALVMRLLKLPGHAVIIPLQSAMVRPLLPCRISVFRHVHLERSRIVQTVLFSGVATRHMPTHGTCRDTQFSPAGSSPARDR